MLASVYVNEFHFIYTYAHIYIFFFRLFSIIGYYKTLNIVPCAI